MNNIIEFKINEVPDSPNKLLGAHWSKRKRHADKWKRLVWAKTWQLVPDQPFKKAKLTMIRFSTHKLDDDNLRSSFKAVVDALVAMNILVDDNPDVIGSPDVRQESTTRDKKCITVRVEGLE